MRLNPIYSLVFLLLTTFALCRNSNIISSGEKEINILVFTKTNGYRHASIPSGLKMMDSLGSANGWNIIATEDSLYFTTENLNHIEVIIFLNTSGQILGDKEKSAFEDFIRKGGGFVGIHAASDTEYDWPFYSSLIGAHFKSHPEIQVATLYVNKSTGHPSVLHFADTIVRKDEWYDFRYPVGDHITVLIEIDENSYQGGSMGSYHPISWYHPFEGGRVFYTAMGHIDFVYSDEDFIRHIEGAIRWASDLIESGLE
ncbi:MAG TPA: ThuA domain-containing protein [Saprospiraceae bacterium]|nr:ThuA domain-containing protein [Saprospiraceae bacterium]